MFRRFIVLAVPASLFAACAEPEGPIHLGFLKDGSTTKDEALMKLGQPSGTFENGRIMTWRLYDQGSGYAQHTGAESFGMSAKYSLVLVFDVNGVLSRHSLVTLWG